MRVAGRILVDWSAHDAEGLVEGRVIREDRDREAGSKIGPTIAQVDRRADVEDGRSLPKADSAGRDCSSRRSAARRGFPRGAGRSSVSSMDSAAESSTPPSSKFDSMSQASYLRGPILVCPELVAGTPQEPPGAGACRTARRCVPESSMLTRTKAFSSRRSSASSAPGPGIREAKARREGRRADGRREDPAAGGGLLRAERRESLSRDPVGLELEVRDGCAGCVGCHYPARGPGRDALRDFSERLGARSLGRGDYLAELPFRCRVDLVDG